MKSTTSGPVLVSGGHLLTPECFGPPQVRLMVRNGETGWSGGGLTVLVWERPEGFPWNTKKARRVAHLDTAEGEQSVVFMGLAPGRYAVTGFEDPAGRRRLARDVFGRPKGAVFLTGRALSLREISFSEQAFQLTHSTIVELKVARAHAAAGRYRTGNIHELRSEKPQSHAADVRGDRRPVEASNRR